VDGGVQQTATIDVAVEQGADLVICYNPFRPFSNTQDGPRQGYRHLSDRGFGTVINQVFRTLLHNRLSLGLQGYLRHETFRGDIVVIEARETDEDFFDMNPMAFWRRYGAIQHGFESVRQTLAEHESVLQPLCESYGLEFALPGEDSRQEEAVPTPIRAGIRG